MLIEAQWVNVPVVILLHLVIDASNWRLVQEAPSILLHQTYTVLRKAKMAYHLDKRFGVSFTCNVCWRRKSFFYLIKCRDCLRALSPDQERHHSEEPEWFVGKLFLDKTKLLRCER